MVAETPLFGTIPRPSTMTGLQVGILKLIYFFTRSTKINETFLPYGIFHAESNEHKIGVWMLQFSD